MHQFCLQAIYNRDYLTLKEIMLKFNYFLQISHQLTDADFTTIISNLKQDTIAKYEPLYLEPSNIYFFFEKGAIYRKEVTGKSEKSIRIRDKNRQITNNNKSIQRMPEFKETNAYQLQQFDSFQEKNYTANKNVYYCFAHKPTIVVRLPLNSLPENLLQLLRNLTNQKIKFLATLGFPLQLQRYNIIENIHKFHYLLLSFGQLLYSKQVRTQHLFFLKNGVVQVHQSAKNKNKCIVNAKSVIGVERVDQESAKCVSDKLQCYIIKDHFLSRYFSKYRQKIIANISPTRYIQHTYRTATHTPTAADQQSQIIQNRQPQFRNVKNIESQYRECLNRGKSVHSSLGNLKERGQQKKRLFKLKQHFSNFYNQVFEQYSQRKVKHMGVNPDSKENLVLYNIKVLQKKAPDMNEIKHKLSKLRMDKLRVLRQKLGRNGYFRQLTLIEIDHRPKEQ